jgi:hypothetical protein
MRVVLIVLSTIFELTGTTIYMVSIARGNTKPHRMTRFIVFTILSLNFASIMAAHGNFGAKLYAGLSFGHGTVLFAMSMWRGLGGTAKLDFGCLAIAAIGILGWKLTGNALVGVWFSILADIAAYVPAFVKTWRRPETESHWLYTLSIFAAGLGLIAYPLGAVSIFQIYIVLCSSTMVFIIFRKKIINADSVQTIQH